MVTLRPLRDYQEACISYTLSSLSPGASFYYVLPTGTGKTRIVTGLVERRKGRVLVIAHRKELIEQLAAAIRDDIVGESVGIMMARTKEPDRRVTVGTVQTLREQQLSWVLSHGAIDTLLIDECHHVVPDSTYDQLIKRVLLHSPSCVVIGCTATPYRSDKVLMQHVLKTCTFERTIPDMQKAGWLSPVAWKSIPIPLALSSVRTSTQDGEKDYNPEELAKVISPASEFIVRSVQPYLDKRPVVVFCCNVEHAHEMARAFNAVGIRAATVWGAMPKEDRETTLRQWKQGYIQVVCNVGVLTEGFDYSPLAPNQHGLGVVIIARPTMSPSLYLQMLGRGTRLKPATSCYQNCLVFDLGDNANLLETKQITLPSVMPSFDVETQREDDFVVFDGKEEQEEEKQKKPPVLRVNDPLSRSWIAWGYHTKSQTYHCKLYQNYDGAGYLTLLRQPSGLYRGFVLTESRKTLPSKWTRQEITDTPQPLIAIMQHCNHVVARVGMKHMVEKQRATNDWRSQEVSEKQCRFIQSLDPSVNPSTWTKGQASNFIDWQMIRPQLIKMWADTVSV